MKCDWHYIGAVLVGLITGINLFLDSCMNMVICGPDPGYLIIRDLTQAVITATLGVLHLWLVYCSAIRTYRSEGSFGSLRTTAIVPLSLVAIASAVRYVVMIAAAWR